MRLYLRNVFGINLVCLVLCVWLLHAFPMCKRFQICLQPMLCKVRLCAARSFVPSLRLLVLYIRTHTPMAKAKSKCALSL